MPIRRIDKTITITRFITKQKDNPMALSKRGFLARLKSTKDDHPLFILGGLMVAALGAGWGAHKEIAPAERELSECKGKLQTATATASKNAPDASAESLTQLAVPVRVGIVGQLSGEF